MKKEVSIHKLFFLIIFVALLLLASVSITYTVSSFSSYSDQVLENNAVYLQKYAEKLDQQLSQVQAQIQEQVYSEVRLTLIVTPGNPDSKRIQLNYQLRELIHSFTPSDGITLFYDDIRESMYFYNGRNLSGSADFNQQRNFFSRFKTERLQTGNYLSDTWFPLIDGETSYLCLVSGRNHAFLCLFINLASYTENELIFSDSAESVLIVWSGDDVLVNQDGLQEYRISVSDLQTDSETVKSSFQHGRLIQSVSLPGCNLGLSVITPSRAIFERERPQIIFAFSMVILIVAIMIIFGRVVRKTLLFPLQEIAQFSGSLEAGREIIVPEEKSAIREYNEIRSGLVQLLDKQAELEQERLTKEQAREHAALQYYQLQTRSHFFLNCLKSLYNMSETNKIPQMQAMILAFSNHLRYIFHDNLMTVSLESELREVSDYHRIILLDYSRIFILTQNVPIEFMNVEVPPLLVQTFLENTYKYNSKTGEPLVFEVSAEKEELDGSPFMKLTLSDNGNGYSKEVLERINEELTGSYDQFNVGINNLRRRLAILYHGACRTEFTNKPEGGACAVIYIPLLPEGAETAPAGKGEAE